MSGQFEDSGAETPNLEAELQRANLKRTLFGDDSIAVKLGRFIVLDLVGAGGMATVFRAYDPDLDRSVALKMIRAELLRRNPAARARMAREARMLAKLSHPNVVAVHEVGTAGDQIFVAMEYVEGQDLAEWMEEHTAAQRRLEPTLAILLQAGRGLAAAHRQDVVHRDFKPANVLLGSDGRVRVADFGLARAFEGFPSELDDPTDPEASMVEPIVSEASLTRTGTVLGTPAYMAPEQRQGGPADVSTDQYSFCVTAWEALCGERPSTTGSIFVGRHLARSVRGRWVADVLRRGLRASPADRFDSMDALLEALERDPTRRRTIQVWSAGVVAAASVAGFGYRMERAGRCDDVAEPAAVVWSQSRQQALSQAFLATEWTLADDSWSRFSSNVDSYVERWVASSDEACRAARIDETLNTEVYTARRACLQEVLTRLDGLLDALAQPDKDLVLASPELGLTLPSLQTCVDHPELSSGGGELSEALARGLGTLDAGRHAGAAEMLAEVAERADAQGDVLISIRASVGRGHAVLETEGPPAAAEVFERAFWRALELGDDVVTVSAAHGLADALVPTRDVDAAERSARLAQVLARRAHLGADTLASIESSLGQVAFERGSLDASERHFREAVRLGGTVHGPDHPRVVALELNLALVLGVAGKLDEAAALTRHAYAVRVEYLGDHHPLVARVLRSLAQDHGRRGQHAPAVEKFRRAISIFEASYGPRSMHVGTTLANLGLSLDQLGEGMAAEQTFRRALEILSQTLEPTDRRVLGTKINIARSLQARGRCDEAGPLLLEAIDGLARAPGGVQVALARLLLAACRIREGESDEARSLLERAREVLGAQPEGGASVDLWLATLMEHEGELDEAYAVAHAARERVADSPRSATTTAGLSFQLASIEAARSRPQAAAEYSRAALEIYREQQPDSAGLVTALARHAAIMVRLGRSAEARAAATEAETLVRTAGLTTSVPAPTGIAVHLALAEATRASDPEGARRAAKEASKWLRRVDATFDDERDRIQRIQAE